MDVPDPAPRGAVVCSDTDEVLVDAGQDFDLHLRIIYVDTLAALIRKVDRLRRGDPADVGPISVSCHLRTVSSWDPSWVPFMSVSSAVRASVSSGESARSALT